MIQRNEIMSAGQSPTGMMRKQPAGKMITPGQIQQQQLPDSTKGNIYQILENYGG